MSEGRPSVPVVQNAPGAFQEPRRVFQCRQLVRQSHPAIPGELPERIEGELPDISVGIREVAVIKADMIADRPHVGF